MYTTKTFYNSNAKIWSGNVTSYEYSSDTSFGEVIINSLKQNPNKISQIIVDNGTGIEWCLTQNDVRLLSIRFAQFLQNYGIKQNDVIGIVGSNSKYLAPIVIGGFLSGTPINALDISFEKEDIIHMFNITKPKIIFCDLQAFEITTRSIEELKLDCEIFLLNSKKDGVKSVEETLVESGNEEEFVVPKLIEGGDQTAIILCSSGTTGLSKGVCASHKRMLMRCVFQTVRSDDVLFSFSPLYWVSAYFMLCSAVVKGATRICINASFSVDRFFLIFEKYNNISVYLSPPSQLAQIIKDARIKTVNFSKLRTYICCGSVLSESIRNEIINYIPSNTKILNGYGMSEILGFCTVESAEYSKYGSTGQIIENFQIKIINDDNQNMGKNEIGEIMVRTHEYWAGYYKDKEATLKAIDQDGWIYSGDLGYFDDNGYLFIVDRKKHILKYKGFHIYPDEIESVILQIPDVIEVAVCGIHDVIMTDLLVAAVVIKKNSTLKEQDIYEYVGINMVDYKKLRGGVYFLKELPKTPSGKIKKKDVKEIVTKLYNLYKNK